MYTRAPRPLTGSIVAMGSERTTTGPNPKGAPLPLTSSQVYAIELGLFCTACQSRPSQPTAYTSMRLSPRGTAAGAELIGPPRLLHRSNAAATVRARLR